MPARPAPSLVFEANAELTEEASSDSLACLHREMAILRGSMQMNYSRPAAVVIVAGHGRRDVMLSVGGADARPPSSREATVYMWISGRAASYLYSAVTRRRAVELCWRIAGMGRSISADGRLGLKCAHWPSIFGGAMEAARDHARVSPAS